LNFSSQLGVKTLFYYIGGNRVLFYSTQRDLFVGVYCKAWTSFTTVCNFTWKRQNSHKEWCHSFCCFFKLVS